MCLRNQALAPVLAFHWAMARIRWMWVAIAERFDAVPRSDFRTAEKIEMKRCKPPTIEIPSSSVLVFATARENSPPGC